MPSPLSSRRRFTGRIVDMADVVLMIDGEIRTPDTAFVLLDDGLVRGDGVFEGLRSYGRRLRDPEAHLQRMARSAARIELPFPHEVLAEELERFAQLTRSPDCGVRVILTRSARRILREEPLPVLPPSWALAPVEHRISPLLIAAKTVSYAANMQAARVALAAGADAPLLVRADDRAVLEGHIFSVCWLEGDRVVFPSLETGILDSLTRRLMFEAIEGIAVRDIPVEGLAESDGVLCVSTVIESQPVHEIVGVGTFPADSRRMSEVREAIAEITRNRLATFR
jgi:branched-subunit amino acid aminotransferase/4-amino-4-deoxychorismate lyase